MTHTDEEVRTLVEEGAMTSAVIGDICDRLGRFHQFLPQPVQGLDRSMTVVGRAMPVLSLDVYGVQPRPFGAMTDALDQLHPGEVYVGGGGLMRNACWGELLTVTAKQRGAVGAVLDGYHRDTAGILAEQWPVFSRGGFAQDAGVRSAVVDFRVPVELGGVLVEPGALVVGDVDGVLVVPRDLEQEIISQALEKATREREVKKAIRDGLSSTAAWERFGVL